MKIKLLLIPVILLAFACQNATKEDKNQVAETEKTETEEIVKVNVQKVQLNIDGMTCTGCENAIQKAINEFDGIYSSTANHQEGIAVVEIDSVKVDLQKVENAINELGYEAKGHKILTK